MRAFTDEETRLFETIPPASRCKWARRRIRSRLRNLGHAVAGLTGLISALHESRSRSAARVIHQYQHLIQKDRGPGGFRAVDDAGSETRASDLAER